jgi:hypothetical protein
MPVFYWPLGVRTVSAIDMEKQWQIQTNLYILNTNMVKNI